MSNEYRDSDYRAYEGFKTDKNSSKNRIRLVYNDGTCDILQYSMINKITYDGSSNIFLVYIDGVYQIIGKSLNGLVDALQSELVHSIFCIGESETEIKGKPVVNIIERASEGGE